MKYLRNETLMTVRSGFNALLTRRLGHDLEISDIISVTKENYVTFNDGTVRPDIHQDGSKLGKVALENRGKNVIEGQLERHRMTEAVEDNELELLVEPLLVQSQCLDKLVAAPL